MFTTTRWSLVLSAADSDGEQRNVGGRRWPSFAEFTGGQSFRLFRRHGYSTEEAQDLTQDFFVMILQSDWLPARRSTVAAASVHFMLKSVQEFSSSTQQIRSATLKRGGKIDFISWDDWMAEAPSQLAVSAHSARLLWRRSDSSIFAGRRRWWSMRCGVLREECEGKGRLRLFETLRDSFRGGALQTSRMPISLLPWVSQKRSVKKQLHNLRAALSLAFAR